MVLKQLGLEKNEWRKMLDVPPDKLLDVQVELGKQPGGGPLTMSGGRRGIGGGGRPGGFGPVVDGTILPHHPFDPEAPAISKDKPLIVGYNRDETIFFFMESHNTDVFDLTEASLKNVLTKSLERMPRMSSAHTTRAARMHRQQIYISRFRQRE
jgi:para-nitrobenzyl esterase